MLTRGKLFVFRSKANAGTRALVPNVWTRKGPTEAGPKLACSRKGAFRTKANAERVRVVPERKAPPKRGRARTSWKEIKMKISLH